MKTSTIVFFSLVAGSAILHSQDANTGLTRDSLITPAAPPTTARILGTIPDGTPPPPSPPKPIFVVAQKDILSTSTHLQGGRTITVREINPIALPPPAPPEPSLLTRDDSVFRARLAEFRASHPKAMIVCLGASVYRTRNSPPRTLVSYWPVGNGEPITLWSSADFALIAGIHSFVGTDGRTRSLFMAWSVTDLDRMIGRFGVRDHPFHPPNIPAFPAGNATFTVIGTPPNAEDLVPIQSLHDLYNSEHDRLKVAYDGRERERLLREAELKANPPRPKNFTLNYWRTERAAPSTKGESAQ